MSIARILLVDDHALVRAGIRNALEDLPNVKIVGEVGDGLALFPALEELQPDCLLIDVTMPDFEPITAVRRIRARFPLLRILVVSAYDDDVYVQGLLGAGVNGYHLKDQSLSELRLAVTRVLAGKRWISSSLLDKLLQPSHPPGNGPVLSSRQRDILVLLIEGLDNRTIASRLKLSVKTIENHLTRLYRQLNVQSRLEAANYVRDHPSVIAQTGDAAQKPPPAIELPQTEQTAVLLIDDNKRYRGQLRRMIGRVCPQAMIYEAGNTAEGANLAQRVSPTLTFVDVVLADEDGIACVRRLKAQAPAARIILMSAYPDREFHRLGLKAGAMAFLDKKDLDTNTLRQIVEDAVG